MKMPRSGPPVAYAAPRNMSNQMRVKSGGKLDGTRTLKVSGREFLGDIILFAGSHAPGDTIFTQNIAPQSIVNSRLYLFSTMYEKYRFRKLRLNFVTQQPTSVEGQYIAYFDYDPADADPVGINNVVKAYSASTNVASNFWQHAEFMMNQNLAQTSYYTSTGVDDRVEIQSVFKIVLNSSLSGGMWASDVTIGTVYITYECDFYGSEFQTSVSSNTMGFSNYYQDLPFTLPNTGNFKDKLNVLSNDLASDIFFINNGISMEFRVYPFQPGVYVYFINGNSLSATIDGTGMFYDHEESIVSSGSEFITTNSAAIIDDLNFTFSTAGIVYLRSPLAHFSYFIYPAIVGGTGNVLSVTSNDIEVSFVKVSDTVDDLFKIGCLGSTLKDRKAFVTKQRDLRIKKKVEEDKHIQELQHQIDELVSKFNKLSDNSTMETIVPTVVNKKPNILGSKK